jgi:DNA-binding CsgD family transcriptional regulator
MTLPPSILAVDVPPLLAVVAAAAGAEHSVRSTHWCRRAADLLSRLLGAEAALVLDIAPAGKAHRVSDFMDSGFTSRSGRLQIVRALGKPTIGDPFLRGALRRFAPLRSRSSAAAFTCADLLTPHATGRSLFCPRQKEAPFSDCLISVASFVGGKLSRHRSALLFFKSASTFSQREKDLLALCHPALAEICAGRLRKSPRHAAALSPRLRQTLRHLATGKDERAIAKRMNLSYHTIHDYVKSLYAHFAVRSRRELLARWSERTAKS